MTIKAVIFDLDGTITQPLLDFDAIRAEMGLSPEAGPILEVMEKMSPEQLHKAQEVLNCHERDAVDQSSLNSGAHQTLENLRQKGIKVGVLTRNLRKNAIAVAQKHGLVFDAVFGRDDGPAKPNAAGILHLCSHFGIKPCQTMMVGDYLFDLLAARNAGSVAVWLRNHEDAREFTKFADFTIDKLSQILQIIDNE